MKYRILVKTEISGKKNYYPQRKKYLLFPWKHFRKVLDMTLFSYKIKTDSLKEAKKIIKKHKIRLLEREKSKIVRTEYINIKI